MGFEYLDAIEELEYRKKQKLEKIFEIRLIGPREEIEKLLDVIKDIASIYADYVSVSQEYRVRGRPGEVRIYIRGYRRIG